MNETINQTINKTIGGDVGKWIKIGGNLKQKLFGFLSKMPKEFYIWMFVLETFYIIVFSLLHNMILGGGESMIKFLFLGAIIMAIVVGMFFYI